jgi:hypothetical protein
MTVNELVAMIGLGTGGSLIYAHQLLLTKPCACKVKRSRRLDNTTATTDSTDISAAAPTALTLHELVKGLNHTAYETATATATNGSARNLFDGSTVLCAGNVIESIASIAVGLATKNPLGTISGGLALANAINDCDTVSDNSVENQIYEVQRLSREGIRQTYYDNLSGAMFNAVYGMRDGCNYAIRKNAYTATTGPRTTDLAIMVGMLEGYYSNLETNLVTMLQVTKALTLLLYKRSVSSTCC